MNRNSPPNTTEGSPILLIPFMWIGDFVRCHSVVKVLRERWPDRPVDMLATSLCAPLVDYMPGVRKGIVGDLPRSRLALGRQRELAARLRAERYGTVLVMPRTWKAALAPFLAGIPERTGFVGEARFGLLNDLRWGERSLPRMIDQCAMLALPKDAAPQPYWPLPEIVVPARDAQVWRDRRAIPEEKGPIVTLAPGAVGPGKAWPASHYTQLAKALTAQGISVWVLGGPNERTLAAEIAAAGPGVRDLTGSDLRDAIIAMTFADAAVTNDSGLMHIAAALGRPTLAIFGPTSPDLWAPLNPLAAIIEPPGPRPEGTDIRKRRTSDVPPAQVLTAVTQTLAAR